jgi:hypothetical protein
MRILMNPYPRMTPLRVVVVLVDPVARVDQATVLVNRIGIPAIQAGLPLQGMVPLLVLAPEMADQVHRLSLPHRSAKPIVLERELLE